MKAKLIYRAFSFFEFVWSLLLRLACVGALVYALAHFDENPVVISIFAGFCLLFIFILGDDQVSVYSDRVVHSTNSLASLLFGGKGRVYKIDELKKAYLKPEDKLPNAFETGVIVLLVALLPKRTRANPTHPIFFDTKSGGTLQLDTHLSHRQMQKIVESVNSLLQRKSR